jgi:multiple sugar transport system permease protein
MGMGISHEPIEWLATAPVAFTTEILIGILVSIPFTTTIFLGGLSSLPQDAYEASMVDGATRWKQFRFLTLPLMRPFINIAIVLNVIYVFNSLPIIWVMTEGGPANGTDILVTYLYKLAFRFGQLGKASAISLIMFGVLFVFIIIYVIMVMRNEDDGGAAGEAAE